jgi:hypothetical protein
VAVLDNGKIDYNDMRCLAMFSRIFSYEFLMRKSGSMRVSFHDYNNDFIVVAYKPEPDRNLMIGIDNTHLDGVFVGYYDDNGNPVAVNGSHYMWIDFNGKNNVKAIISQNVLESFNISLDL